MRLIDADEFLEKLDHSPLIQDAMRKAFDHMPTIQPEQRYTEEELRIFEYGIKLRLLSKRSAQHWNYDEDRAKEIEFLEQLYGKVCADIYMR